MEYDAIVWGPYMATDLNKLEIIQRQTHQEKIDWLVFNANFSNISAISWRSRFENGIMQI